MQETRIAPQGLVRRGPTCSTLDLMFNNAGIGTGSLLDEQPWAEIERIVAINFLGG